jgi:hypothetical protein
VRAIFVAFGDKKDSKTGKPLFNSLAWTKARNLLEEIKRGFYSDPPGFNFYTYEMVNRGNVKTDSYGIPLLRCCRGTNMVECIHRQYNATMRHRSGIEMGDVQLAERRPTGIFPEWAIMTCGKLTFCKNWWNKTMAKASCPVGLASETILIHMKALLLCHCMIRICRTSWKFMYRSCNKRRDFQSI